MPRKYSGPRTTPSWCHRINASKAAVANLAGHLDDRLEVQLEFVVFERASQSAGDLSRTAISRSLSSNNAPAAAAL